MRKPVSYDELARKCAADGMTIMETARACGKDWNAIFQWGKRSGVKFSRKPRKVAAMSDLARKMAADGVSQTEAARALGVHPATLGQWARENKVDFEYGGPDPSRLKGRAHCNRVEVSISMAPDDFETLKAKAVAENVTFSRLVTRLALRQIEQERAKE